jgi:hypothetical protein
MGKPIRYVYYTPAGELELSKTEEQIEKDPNFYALRRPTEGRQRYVAALSFMLREKLDEAAGHDWFIFVNAQGIQTTLRPSAISGFRILESIGGEPSDEPQIGFRKNSNA